MVFLDARMGKNLTQSGPVEPILSKGGAKVIAETD